ncbi:MAG: hypothetical protein ACKV22_16065 [Bryobacteraceae bacterium]
MCRRLSYAISLALAVTPVWVAAQQTREASPAPIRGDLPEHLQKFKTGGLPPVGERVEFEGLETFPPKVKGLDVDPNFRLNIKPGTRPSVREARSKMREIAMADARVRASLGNRFALLGSGWLESSKDQGGDVTSERYRLVFYSYQNNVSVNVVVERNQVVDVVPGKKGYQPAESHEEVEAAADLVKRDDRYRALVEGLVARGIETPSEDGHRRLYVTFHKQKRTPAVVEATVDMTLGRVVIARRLRR